jgi:hypothetical protein
MEIWDPMRLKSPTTKPLPSLTEPESYTVRFVFFLFSFLVFGCVLIVVADSEGINREELNRLATNRKMVDHFDLSKLSPSGFRVLVTEKNVTLPSGEKVFALCLLL